MCSKASGDRKFKSQDPIFESHFGRNAKLNSQQQLFSRFEKAGPSWLPIIVMSLIGLGLTVFAVEAVSKLTGEEFSQRQRRLYLLSRDVGLFETLLFQVSNVRPETLSELELERLAAAKSMIPELTFLGALVADPAFENADGTGRKRPASTSDDEERLLYFWADESGTSVLLGQVDWLNAPSMRALAGTDQSGTDQSGTDQSGTDRQGTDQSGDLRLAGGLMFSRPKGSESRFLTTVAIAGEVPIDRNEVLANVNMTDSGAIKGLLSQHLTRTQGTTLESVSPDGLDVFVQDFLNQRAFAFINRGGLTNQELTAPMMEIGDDIPEDVRRTIVLSFVLGWRNGVSKQFDQFVLERASRDVTLNEGTATGESGSNPTLLILHPLTCPIRTRSILDGIDPQTNMSTKESGEAIRVPAVDYPPDIEQRIAAFAKTPADFTEVLADLEKEIRGRGDCKELYQLADPFPATVFEINASPLSP